MYSENQPVIIELKTSAVETDKKETLNFQTMFYAWIYYKRYHELPLGVIKRTLKKPRIKQKKDETVNAFCERVVIDVGEKEDKYFLSGYRAITIEMVEKFEKYLYAILIEMHSTNEFKFYKNPMELWP